MSKGTRRHWLKSRLQVVKLSELPTGAGRRRLYGLLSRLQVVKLSQLPTGAGRRRLYGLLSRLQVVKLSQLPSGAGRNSDIKVANAMERERVWQRRRPDVLESLCNGCYQVEPA